MSTTTSPGLTSVTAPKSAISIARFFRAQRGDSPFKRLLIHLTLIVSTRSTG